MELRDKCFHSIHSYRYDAFKERIRLEEVKDILMKMEMIFKSGYILPYREIVKLYGNVSRNKFARFNGDDMVSISLHKDSPEDADLEYKKMFNSFDKISKRTVQGKYKKANVKMNEIKI